MQHRDHTPQQNSDPPTADLEGSFRSLLDADARPVICAASAHQLRRVLRDIAGHLCYRLRLDMTGSLPPGPASHVSWGVCEAASATRAGFQLYHYVGQVIAAGCLHVIGFDPHQAAADDTYFSTSVEPALTAASRQLMRGLLLDLAGHIEASMDDADTSAILTTADGLPEEAWEAGTGVSAAIGLYRHATVIQTGYVLYKLWAGLTNGPPSLMPFTPGTPAATVPAISPN